MRAKRKAFVGIDVAFAMGKPLPVCVYAAGPDGVFDLLPLKRTFDKPPVGQGNAAALSPGLRRGFAARTSAWLRALETRENLSIHGIALDAPSDYCPPERTHRACEAAVARDGIAVFFTPTKARFDVTIAEARRHLADGGPLHRLPGAMHLWMLVGFDLFRELEKEYPCLETYPQAVVRRLGCATHHKTTARGLEAQLAKGAELLGTTAGDFLARLAASGYGSTHDKLDAFFAAWVASLEKRRESYGDSERDAIWVPRAMD